MSTCHCGKPLHYSDPQIEESMQGIVGSMGEFIKVKQLSNGKTYLVQRHYIALHGIKGSDDLGALGFKEA